MSKQASRAQEITVEDVKDALDKEQLCLLKVKGMIQQQLKVLQAEAATIQRLMHAQGQPKTTTQAVESDVEYREMEQDHEDISDQLPELNLDVSQEMEIGSHDQEEIETESEED